MMISVDAKRPPLKFNTHLYSYKNTLLYKIKINMVSVYSK